MCLHYYHAADNVNFVDNVNAVADYLVDFHCARRLSVKKKH